MISRLSLVMIAAMCLLAGCAGCRQREPGFELPPALQHPPNETVLEQEQERARHFRVYAGFFDSRKQAEEAARRLTAKGLSPQTIEFQDGLLIRVDEMAEYEAAEALQEKLAGWGFDAFTTRGRPPDADTAQPHTEEPGGKADGEATPAPFCDTRPALPELTEQETKEHIRLDEDTQARDPELWIDEMTDPGCVLLTEEEAHALLVANAATRRQLNLRLAAVEQLLREAHLTVYLGSYLCAEDAEGDAARAASAGIDLSIQAGPGGSWIAVAPPAASEDKALDIERRLGRAGLTNHARLTPTAEDQAAPAALRAQLRELRRKDRIARLVLEQYAY